MMRVFGDNTFLQRGSPPPPPWRLSPNALFDRREGESSRGNFIRIKLIHYHDRSAELLLGELLFWTGRAGARRSAINGELCEQAGRNRTSLEHL